MNFTKIWIIFFLFNLSFNFCNGSKSSNQPKAEKGKLDLSNWDFNKNTNSHSSGIVYLDGKWKFYWEQFCDPNKIILDSCNIVEENNLNEKYLSIPGNWVHQNYPSYGYATYLLNITLPDEHPELSLNMTDAGTAYSMYINGQLISKNGEVGKNEYESEPLLKHKIIDIKNFEGNELKILIHVSNFHHRKAGLWDRIQLGPSSSIHREDKQKSILNLLILSSLIIMGLYHLGFYFNRTKDISPLFFGILCLLFSLRTICMGDRFIMDIFPSIPFWIIHKLDYFSIFFSGFILLKFVQSLFPDEFSPKLGKILNFLFITLVLIVIFFSMKVYVYTIDPFQLIASFTILYTFKTTIKAIKNQRVGSILFLLGSLIFGSFIVNDILKTIGFIYTPYLANVGVLGFILFQPIILSRKFNHAFREIEELSETLETKISEGVKEQQRYNNCLLELANSKTIFEVGFDKAVEEITETCARIMKIDRCSIWIFNDRLNELECINLYNKKENFHSKGGILKSSDYPTYFEYIKMGVILSAPNINKHSNTFELKDTYSNPNNIYSLLNIPILSFGKQTGIISLEQTGKFQDWTGEEISFASSVSSIITNLFEIHQKENMYLDLQKTKQELEDLNKFSSIVNSLSKLDKIFTAISKHFHDRFNIQGTWLFLPDKNLQHLYSYKIYCYKKLSEENYNYLLHKKIPLNEEGGIQYLIYQKKKTLFLPKIKKIEFPIDKEIVETLNAKSALYIPLVSKDKCVGIICFSNLDKEMKLSKNEIITITNLCAQISGAIQTAHLLERVDKAKKESDLLNEISKTANSNLNIHQIIYNTMDYIKSNFEIDICSVMLPNKKYSKIKTIYLSNKDSIYYEEGKKLLKSNAFSLKEPNNIHGKVFQSKKTHYSKDLEKSENDTERKIIKLFKLRNFICIPLILKEEVIGFLDFSKYNGEMELSEEDVSFLEKVADVLATSINNSKLLMETEKKKKETEELNKLIKSLNEELDVSLIMDKFFRFVNKEFNIQYYGLYSINPDQTHLEILNIKFPDFISEEDKKVILNYKLPLDNLKGAHAFTLRTKKTFHLPKIKKSRVTEEELFLLEKGKFQSILMIPLILNNKPIGILDLSNCFEPMAITKEDFTRLSILGEQLAGIINGSSLFKQVQEEREIVLKAKKEVEATKQEIEFFNEFSKKINSSNILEEIFDDAVMELFDRLGTDFFWLQMVNKKNNQLVTRCLAGGINPELNKLLINWKVNYSSETQYLFKSWSDQKTIYVKDINKQNNENLHEIERTLIRELKTNSVFTIPLLVQDEVIGLMNINKIGGMNSLSNENIRFTKALCEQLAIAVNNSYLYEEAENERQKSENLLLNILPKQVAKELKNKGYSEPVSFENVTVIFTDFKGFTQIAENLSPQDLVRELDQCFSHFDSIIEKYNLEKLKTIGDSYMCAGGVPKENQTHAIDSVHAAIEIQQFMNEMKKEKEEKGIPYWELRLGIHSGPLVAGVIGKKKFAYDVWGDTVNTASRMESSGVPGMINISGSTFEMVKDHFNCEYRGKVSAKNKGEVDMYFVKGVK